MTREETRLAVIGQIETWAEENGINPTFIGCLEDRHMYADAIIGTMSDPPAIVYSAQKVVEALAEMMGGNYEQALEFYEYNTLRGLQYVPKKEYPPVLVDVLTPF